MAAGKDKIKKNIPKKSAKKKQNKKAVTKKNDKADELVPAKIEAMEVAEADKHAQERGDRPMSIVGHLDELRSRLIVSLITITIVTFAAFFFLSDYILNAINRPYIKTGLKLNAFTLSEGFIVRAKASLISGILVGLPVIVYEIWKYILPAINKRERRFIGLSITGAVFLMYSGIALTYFFLLPIAIKMLLNFMPDNVDSIIGASKYLSFTTMFCLAMGFMFELPIVIMILTKMGVITPRLLISKRKYAIVLIFIAAGILTPGPDILLQLMVAVPMMLLYEISIIISKMMIKRKLKQKQ